MFLTQAQRQRFAEYAEAEHFSYRQMAEQLSKLSGQDAAARMLQAKAAAWQIVVKHLREVETQTLNKD